MLNITCICLRKEERFVVQAETLQLPLVVRNFPSKFPLLALAIPTRVCVSSLSAVDATISIIILLAANNLSTKA
jgi:hypothetical protein